MCIATIIDMRNNSKYVVDGNFETFNDALQSANLSLDFSKAKGVVSETRNSLETGSARLPNLAEYKIYIYAKESKGGLSDDVDELIDELINNFNDEINELKQNVLSSISEMQENTVEFINELRETLDDSGEFDQSSNYNTNLNTIKRASDDDIEAGSRLLSKF